jgi:hypothetical protein
MALPMGVLGIARQEAKARLMSEALYLPTASFCRARRCLRAAEAGPSPLRVLFAAAADSESRGGPFRSASVSGDFQGTGFVIEACVDNEADGRFCFRDADALRSVGAAVQGWFAFLACAAHAVWLFGGSVLLWLHRRASFKRAVGR